VGKVKGQENWTPPHLPAVQIRDEWFKLVCDMLALALRGVATLPVRQQQQVRAAMKALADVQTWCKAHAAEEVA